MSTLYLVATPIGNLGDITYRAVEVLSSVDIIACEDTRHTQNLLNHYKITKRLIATHAHNEANSAKGIINLLEEGHDIAFVSDAGTPGISDPGSRLVETVRSAGFDIVPIPGASALTTLVSVAGYIGRCVHFEGFLSPKSGRRKKRLEELLTRDESFVFYESPFRVVKVIEELSALEPKRRVVVGREMTKKFEEFLVGPIEEVFSTLKARSAIKGEFAVLIAPKGAGAGDDHDQETEEP